MKGNEFATFDDNDIVKALECCKIGECGECAKCVPNNNGKSCRDNLIDLASDLINRKNAEIKEKDIEIDILIKKKDTAYDEVAELKAEVENLNIELKAMRGTANSYKAEVERLQKKERAKCGTCAYSKPTTFGKSKCYVECTNQEHIMQFCRYREISLKRQRTTPACKRYKEMVGEKDV